MTLRRVLLALCFALLAWSGVAGASAIAAGNGDGGHGEIGTKVPEFSARNVGEDTTWSLRGDGKGTVVLLNVWATWCVPCRKEMPDLAALQREFEGDVEVVGVSVDDEGFDESVQEFATRVGADFRILRDPDKDVQRRFRTSGVPETVLVDPSGVVAYRWKGPLKLDASTRRVIRRAIDEEGSYLKSAKADVDNTGIGIFSAMLAGLLSFLSPCVLPLVPSYAAFLGASGPGRSRRSFLARGGSFVLGFSLIFIGLGVAATALGGAALDSVPWIARVGGVLLVLLGLGTIGLLRIPGFDTERRVMGQAMSRVGNGPVGAFVIGAAFAAGWTPCIGPILAGILTLAAATQDVARGAILLTAYSAGLAIPFLATTVLVARVPSANRRIARIAPYAQKITGVLLIAIGILLVSGQLTRLAALTSEVVPWSVG
ncbi:MAG: Disulfide bond oxidoreductase family protein [Thermoleophilia bacterium]|nr:Disulfide bond oxidoreductase family protein [Thermoleophilia bacterium]